jgi:hypothetical protein
MQSKRIKVLVDQLAEHEAAIVRIKQELALLLLGPAIVAEQQVTPEEQLAMDLDIRLGQATSAKHANPSSPQGMPVELVVDHEVPGAVAPGTIGRKVLDTLRLLGGQASIDQIVQGFPRDPAMSQEAHSAMVRRNVHNMSRSKHSYVEPAGGPRAGLWKLSRKGREIAGT